MWSFYLCLVSNMNKHLFWEGENKSKQGKQYNSVIFMSLNPLVPFSLLQQTRQLGFRGLDVHTNHSLIFKNFQRDCRNGEWVMQNLGKAL